MRAGAGVRCGPRECRGRFGYGAGTTGDLGADGRHSPGGDGRGDEGLAKASAATPAGPVAGCMRIPWHTSCCRLQGGTQMEHVSASAAICSVATAGAACTSSCSRRTTSAPPGTSSIPTEASLPSAACPSTSGQTRRKSVRPCSWCVWPHPAPHCCARASSRSHCA